MKAEPQTRQESADKPQGIYRVLLHLKRVAAVGR